MFDNPLEHAYLLIVDLIIFFVKSFYYVCETIILTLVPDRFRKFKVS
jgi:hypothetical protein